MATDEIPVIEIQRDNKEKHIVNAWWKIDDDEKIYTSVVAIVKSIKKNQSYRRTDHLRFARLYTNTDFDQFLTGVAAGYFGRRLSFNVARATVDTACAKISKSRPRPLFLTSAGNFKQIRRAKNLTKYIDGVFYDGKIHKVGKRVFRDACIFGTGAMKIYPKDGKMVYERVFIDEITVDDLDGRDGEPRQLHQTKLIHRDVLYGMFADADSKKEKERINKVIENTPRFSQSTIRSAVDMVQVIESWHLPSGKDSGDGKHTICTEQGTLFAEEWDKPYFPFCFISWNPSVLGFFGEGLVSQVVGIQLEINLLLLRIKEALELMAVPRILVEEGSGVNASAITDEIGGIIRYRGTKPDAVTWSGMNRETYDYLEYLYRKAFEDTGISQLSAMSKKPAGLDSGVALREFQDIETERFAIVAEAWQDFYLDAARITIDIQRALAEENKNLFVNVKGKDFIETIKWKDVDLDDDQFVMQVFPTNLLPKTPEGQLQFTQELLQSGLIDPAEGLSLLNFPDLEGFFNLRVAAYEDISQILENIIDDQDYTPPDEYMDLQLAIRVAQSTYLRSKTDGTSALSKELLLRFIDECADLIALKNMPPPTPQPGEALPPDAGQGAGQPLGPIPADVPPAPGVTARPERAPRSDLMRINPNRR